MKLWRMYKYKWWKKTFYFESLEISGLFIDYLSKNGSHAGMLSPFCSVWLFTTPWIIACLVLLSMGSSRQEHEWVAMPSSRGYLPHSGIEPVSLKSLALAGTFFTTIAIDSLSSFYKWRYKYVALLSGSASHSSKLVTVKRQIKLVTNSQPEAKPLLFAELWNLEPVT